GQDEKHRGVVVPAGATAERERTARRDLLFEREQLLLHPVVLRQREHAVREWEMNRKPLFAKALASENLSNWSEWMTEHPFARAILAISPTMRSLVQPLREAFSMPFKYENSSSGVPGILSCGRLQPTTPKAYVSLAPAVGSSTRMRVHLR